jgi:hypothetical protein
MDASDSGTSASGTMLEVYDKKHLPHLVMTLFLSAQGLNIEPSAAARELIEQDLRVGREEARHLPVVGWLLERAMVFAEHRMADYFGLHELKKVHIRFDGTVMGIQIGRGVLELGPGEIDADAAKLFFAEYMRLKQMPHL